MKITIDDDTKLYDVNTLMEIEGISKVVNTEDDRYVFPMCCDEKMECGSGVLGTDIITCSKCGKELRNIASPHVNGGYLPPEEWFEAHNQIETWLRTDNFTEAEAARRNEAAE